MKAILLLALLFAADCNADPALPTDSLYNLTAVLTDQAGERRGLDTYRGHPVLVTMFYGSCPNACPLLIDTLRVVESSVPAPQRAQLRVLMISIDPDHDTVTSLQALTQARRLDASRWTLARTDAATVRKIAAVLNVQYRQLPDGGYNHSSIITLLGPQGEIELQSSVLGKADERLVEALRKTSASATTAAAGRK